MTGIMITSTGTNIGKTTLLAQLLRYDRQASTMLTASKPVISGWPNNDKDIQHTDTGILLASLALPLTEDNIEAMSPWRFHAPLTPSMAAKKEGKNMDCQALVAHCEQQILASYRLGQHHLIEGVGGIMAPIWEKWTGLDWAVQLGCPCILVVGSYLGTISHTLTAVTVLQNAQVPILAVVVSESVNSTVGFIPSCQELAHLLSPIPVYPFPCCQDLSSVALLYHDISSQLSKREDKVTDFV